MVNTNGVKESIFERMNMLVNRNFFIVKKGDKYYSGGSFGKGGVERFSYLSACAIADKHEGSTVVSQENAVLKELQAALSLYQELEAK